MMIRGKMVGGKNHNYYMFLYFPTPKHNHEKWNHASLVMCILHENKLNMVSANDLWIHLLSIFDDLSNTFMNFVSSL